MSISAPYDTVYTAILIIKERIGDAIETLLPLGGQVAGNGNYYSQQLFNSAWRKLQQFLVSQKYERFRTQNYVVAGLPPAGSVDTSIQVVLSWAGYNDGVSAINTAYVLPQDLIRPIKLYERPTQSPPNQTAFTDVDLPQIDFIPSDPKQQWNGIALWAADGLQMRGATVVTDLRIEYLAYLADFADTGNLQSAVGFVPWYEQTIPIMRAAEAQAMFTLAEIEIARGNQDAAVTYVNAGRESAVMDIIGIPAEQ